MRPWLLALAFASPGLLVADEVHLKSGGRLSGQVVSEDERSVVIEVGPGRVTIPARNVQRIERGTSPISAFRERAARLAPDDASGWLSLAFWAQERDLVTQAHEAFERVLRQDPENASANAALGRVLWNGRYVTVDESYRERGYVRYDGEWISPAEHEARLRSRAAEEAATRLEGDLRVREAEARARQAEAEARRAEAEAQAGAWTYGEIPAWGWGSPVIYPPVLLPPEPLLPPLAPLPRATPLPPNPLTRPGHPTPTPPPRPRPMKPDR